jgi:hypothetical protein
MTIRKYISIIPMLNGNKYFGIRVGRDVLNAFLRGCRLTNKKYAISVNAAKKTIWPSEIK